MNPQGVTEQILSAWADETEEAPPDDTVTEPEPAVEEPPEEPDELEGETPEPEPEEPEEEEEGEEGEEGEEEEAEAEALFETDDPEIQAFLAKYQGDPYKALKGAAEAQRLLGRQGTEKAELARQVQALTEELERRVRLDDHGGYLNQEQQQWVENAVAVDPRGHVRAAVEAGQFDLARAVCEVWSQEQPYEAARLAAQVDQIEQRAIALQSQPPEEVQVDHGALMNVLVEHFPEMPAYEDRMVSTLAALGEQHPLVQDARSNDPETAARGIVGIFEIARASSATVKQTRARVRANQRQAADEARRNGVVSSGTASPAPAETPRPTRVTPGLTMDELDEAFKNA